jgi:1,4-alpha-glucan branching enzyme
MLTKKYFKTKDEVEVTFEFGHVPAEEVTLVCDGADWAPVEMKKSKDGSFKAKLRLPVDGQFQFRYLLDGQRWENDEAADAYVANEYGGDNSVVYTARNGNGHK